MTDRTEPAWSEMVLVGTVARPHGLRGHVVINAQTDFPDERFRPGAALWLEHRPEQPLIVESARLQSGRPIVGFVGFDSVEQAEELTGRELRIPEHDLRPLPAGRFYHHQLVGCAVVARGGAAIGDVVKVEDGAGGSLLVVAAGAHEVLIPLAEEICTVIDVDGRRIEVTLPEGLLELNETRRSRRS